MTEVHIVIVHRARALRRIGALGVAMIVAVAGLMLAAVPASAAPTTNYAYPTTHYENVGNPGWCLDGNDRGDDAYLHRCGAGQVDYQKWQYTSPATYLQLIHDATPLKCLTAWSPGDVTLSDCGSGNYDRWNALTTGTTGQVMLQNVLWGDCLAPSNTGIPGQSTYHLVLRRCDVTNTLVKWRYFN